MYGSKRFPIAAIILNQAYPQVGMASKNGWIVYYTEMVLLKTLYFQRKHK